MATPQDWNSFFNAHSFFFTPERAPLHGTRLLHYPYRRLFGATRLESSQPFNQLLLKVAVNDPSKVFSIAFSDPPYPESAIPEGGFEASLSHSFPADGPSAVRIQDCWASFQAFVPDHRKRAAKERDLGVVRYSATVKHHFSRAPLTISGLVSLGSFGVSSAPLRIDVPLYWRDFALNAHAGAELSSIGHDSALKVKSSAGFSLSRLATSAPVRATLSFEGGYQPESETLEMLDPHTCSEHSIHTIISKCRTLSLAFTNADALSDASVPGWGFLASYRKASHLNCASLAAIFQYFPSPFTKADCGAILSYIDNSEFGPQSVLTAASRWRFVHPNAGMQSHLSVKLSTGLDSGPVAIAAIGVTFPELRIGRASLSFVSKVQRGNQVRHAFRVELDSLFSTPDV